MRQKGFRIWLARILLTLLAVIILLPMFQTGASTNMLVFVLAPGAFITLGFLIALFNLVKK